jgi:hypothetical protein
MGASQQNFTETPRKLHRNSTETPQKLHRNDTETLHLLLVFAARRCYALSTLSEKKQIVSDNSPTKAVEAPVPPVDSPLLPEWAFVVQFRTETEIEQGRWVGRVEHVVSGQATRFHSLEELLAFFTRILTTVRVQPPSES